MSTTSPGESFELELQDLPEATWAHIATFVPPLYLRSLRASCVGLRDLLDTATIAGIEGCACCLCMGFDIRCSGGATTTPPPSASHFDTLSGHVKAAAPPPAGTLAASTSVYPAGGMGQLSISLPFTTPTARAMTAVFPRVRRLRIGSDHDKDDEDVGDLCDEFVRFCQQYLPSFSSLNELDLLDLSHISETGLCAAADACRSLTCVTSLSLQRIEVIANPHSPFDCLPGRMDSLQRLHVNDWSISEDDVAELARLPNLAELIIDFYMKPPNSDGGDSEWEDASEGSGVEGTADGNGEGSSTSSSSSRADAQVAVPHGQGPDAVAAATAVAAGAAGGAEGAADGDPVGPPAGGTASELWALARKDLPLAALAAISSLRSLSLVGYHGRCAGLAALSESLEGLELDGGAQDGLLDAADLMAIRDLTRLTSLQLHNFLPLQEDLEVASSVVTPATSNLRELALTSPVSAECIRLLSQLPHLTSLEASVLHIHDDDLWEEDADAAALGVAQAAGSGGAGAVGAAGGVAGAGGGLAVGQAGANNIAAAVAALYSSLFSNAGHLTNTSTAAAGASVAEASGSGTAGSGGATDPPPAIATAAGGSSSAGPVTESPALVASLQATQPAGDGSPTVCWTSNAGAAKSVGAGPPDVTAGVTTQQDVLDSAGVADVSAEEEVASELSLPHLQRLILDELGDYVLPLRQLAPNLRELHIHSVSPIERRDDVRLLLSDIPPCLTDVALWLKDDKLDLRHAMVDKLTPVKRLSLEVPASTTINHVQAALFISLQHLEELALRSGDINVAGAKVLTATLFKVRRLRLMKMERLKSSVLSHLAKMPRLEQLCLDACTLDKPGGLVEIISHAPMLRDVVLRGCKGLSEGDIARLHAAVSRRGRPVLALCVEEMSAEEVEDLQIGMDPARAVV